MPKFSSWPQALALLGGVAFAVCQWLIFAYAPKPPWAWCRKFFTSTCPWPGGR